MIRKELCAVYQEYLRQSRWNQSRIVVLLGADTLSSQTIINLEDMGFKITVDWPASYNGFTVAKEGELNIFWNSHNSIDELRSICEKS